MITPARGSDPMNVVNYAEELGLRAIEEESPYNRIYCVFDRDGHANYVQAMDKINRSNEFLRAVTSHPCFEVWVLQHFSDSTAPFAATGGRSPCDNVIRAIRDAGFPDYSKDIGDLYVRLSPSIETALLNARRLERHNSGNGSPNPATNFHELVDYLRGIKS
jgi:hypothetical protein